EHVYRGAARRPVEPFEGRELDRLCPRDLAPIPVADDDLHRRTERRNGERDCERRALVAAPTPTEAAERVGGRDEEARNDVAGQIHVDELVPEVAVAEERLHRMHVDDFASTEIEAGRMI